jgi:PTS system glucitol/sorbitol-specific IIA component
MTLKYNATITYIGPLAGEFLAEQIIVLFGQHAPEELAEFSLIHDGVELTAPFGAGDTVTIGDHAFQILAVGEVANDNLANLGHLVLKFNGEREVEMPGDVCLEAVPLPEVTVGTVITIKGE